MIRIRHIALVLASLLLATGVLAQERGQPRERPAPQPREWDPKLGGWIVCVSCQPAPPGPDRDFDRVPREPVQKNGHTHGLFRVTPDPGYTWISLGPYDQRVRWQAGLAHPKYAHIVSSRTEGRWRPQDGYDWVGKPPPAGPWRVRWKPNIQMTGNPRVLASEIEGQWLPDWGYAWAGDPMRGDWRVYWHPGMALRGNPHVVAGNVEGRFDPAEGYEWVNPDDASDDFRVRWVPGKPRKDNPNVLAGGEEGLFTPADGYAWAAPSPSTDLRLVWQANLNAVFHPHLISTAVEGEWRPAPGWVWAPGKTHSEMQVAPIPPEAPAPRPVKALREEPNGFFAGTGWRMAYALPSRPTAAKRREAIRLFQSQSEVLGQNYVAGVDTSRYDFAIGLARSTNKFRDLTSRVLFDQFSAGKATPWMQAEYDRVKGKAFGELGCHSNGAMICLAALENGDVTARHVVLYGPQITVESLRMWDRLVREGRVGSIEMYVSQNDPIAPASLLLSLKTGPFGAAAYSIASIPLLYRVTALESAVEYLAPSINVKAVGCEKDIYTLECHDMARYRAARGCVTTPVPSGERAPGPGPQLPGGRTYAEPPPPC